MSELADRIAQELWWEREEIEDEYARNMREDDSGHLGVLNELCAADSWRSNVSDMIDRVLKDNWRLVQQWLREGA